ncbi:GGDEF domain-containing protein [Clostridium sp. 1001271B_151109_B4]|uniref:GGDEF domain-containing protein n=1 Tax=Clostridium sp. 1001271B_151109_B4 TaxID=2787148 RepID=UPI001FAE70F9|nr:GGDEF domain-containing protein [Clostridium sp. 1001271B_151109_B4]
MNNLLSEKDYLIKIFDGVRVVDPIKKIVVKQSGMILDKENKCFNLCKKKNICNNCISIRAYNENRCVMKIEYINERIYMIMATPIDTNNSQLVIETLKDITECNISEFNGVNTTEDLHKKINKVDKMNKLVVTDELTQCYNRRYINERLPVDIDKAKRENEELSIVLVDVDHFKDINDKYGHLAGDLILKELINVIKSNIRTTVDWIARYGGEEFLIVFNGATKEEAYNISDKIRLIVEKNVFKYQGININITISIGISTLNQGIINIDELIEVADKNLYKAKKNGRNLVAL